MDWIRTYIKHTKKHEAPELFHLWCAVAAIAAALERKVWTRLMLEKLYPNMYIILVAPPGRCRKNSAISVASKLVGELSGVSLCSEKITPEALIRSLGHSESSYHIGTRLYTHSSLTSVAKELDTFFSCNPEGMLELLTDIFDSQSHDHWTYETKVSGTDEIRGVWFNLLAGTTPSFFAKPVMRAGIGGGFTSRCVFVYQDKRRGRSLDCDDRLDGELADGLAKIHEMQGEFKKTEEADKFYREWYLPLPDDIPTIEALMPYYERKHAHVLKLATIIAASHGCISIQPVDIQEALSMLKMTELLMPMVYRGVGGTGRDFTAFDIERVLAQIENSRQPLSKEEIINTNYIHVPRLDRIKMILDTLEQGGMINRTITPEGQQFYTATRKEETK